jgi:hypothetical protein
MIALNSRYVTQGKLPYLSELFSQELGRKVCMYSVKTSKDSQRYMQTSTLLQSLHQCVLFLDYKREATEKIHREHLINLTASVVCFRKSSPIPWENVFQGHELELEEECP